MTNKEIKFVGIVVKPNNEEAMATARQLPAWFAERGIAVVGEPRQEAEVFDAESFDLERFKNDVDLIVVLGGDGTMISTARLTGEREVLVLGINYGSLGYLTEFRIEEMYAAIESILEGNYDIDQRMMLDVELWRGEQQMAAGRVLNDVVINKAVLARIIEVEVSLNNLYVNSFRADGLIIATPTGSTAYNLSAGGPIIYPSMNAVVITPICPFTLTNRPIVMPDTAEISMRLENESDGVVLTLDGQVGHHMEVEDCVKIRRSKTNFNLVQPSNRNYFDVLRNKLKWGR
jgi:NAD+ kinase